MSYASEDAAAAVRISAVLRDAGVEVWFDQQEFRGGEAWDAAIRRQIQACALFMPVISRNAHTRSEGYFRLEWKLAVDRSHRMAPDQPFLVPVVLDDTHQNDERIPERFRELHWLRAPQGDLPAAGVAQILRLLAPQPAHADGAAAAAAAGGSGSGSVSAGRAFPWRKLIWPSVAALVIAGALAYGVLWRSRPDGTGAPAPVAANSPAMARSIAVLPFADMSEKKDQEYFADGLSEEILNLLARVPSLSVIGRTSSFQFKGQGGDLRAIGSKLGAAYVLEGSVRRAGDRVRVTAQLISTRDGTHLWSNTYDRASGDVLQLQDELASEVARAMEVSVDIETLRSHGATSNPEAYDFYLRGLHSMELYNREGFESGATYFQQALDLDPRFADAATQLARMVIFQAEWEFTPAVPAYARARHNLETAIRLDPKSGQAYAWLGWIHMAYDWDWPAAESEMKQALQLASGDPVVHLCAARLAASQGRLDEAIALLKSGLARDPLYAAAMNSLSEVYARAGRLAEAEATERRVLEISPTYTSAPRNLAVILLAQGRPEEALNIVLKQQQATVDRVQALALIYHDLGRKAESDAQLAAMIRQYADDDAFGVAEAFSYFGRSDEAFRWLERAFRQKDAELYFFKASLLFDKVAGDPRYRAFLRKMNLTG